MLISTLAEAMSLADFGEFQSLDWVDVDFDGARLSTPCATCQFQSLDWVDVDFDLDRLVRQNKRMDWFQSLDWVDVDFDGQ